MKESFIKLLDLLELNDYKETIHGKLIEMLVDERRSVWFFNIELEKPLEIEVFKLFEQRLLELPALTSSCEGVAFNIDYENTDYSNIAQYYKHILDNLKMSKPRYHAMSDFEVECEGNQITILCPEDGGYVQDLLYEIEKRLEQIGFEVTLTMRICEQAQSISERIMQEQEDSFESVSYDPAPNVYFVSYKDRTIKQVKHKISDIPVTEEQLNEYKSLHHKANFSIEATITSSEERKINKNTTLYTFVLSDDEDSIYVKKFVRDEDELEFLRNAEPQMQMRIQGAAQYDQFVDEVVLTAQTIERTNQAVIKEKRLDEAEERRVELHLHSKMSTLDGIDAIKDYVDTAVRFKHKAIALTDHNNVQAFPEFYQAVKNKPIKPIYGTELSTMFEYAVRIAQGESAQALDEATFVVFDIETTGLSVSEDKIIEISAMKIKNHQIIEQFDAFVNPEQKLSAFTTKLTGITDSDVKTAKTIDQVMPDFKAFIEGAILVAHNATFDMGHIHENLKHLDLYEADYPSIDTLQIARQVYGDKIKRFNLKAVAKLFKVELKQHHRAEYDTRATTDIFLHMLTDLMKLGVKTLEDLNHLEKFIPEYNPYKNAIPRHLSVLVKTQTGLKNLYKIVSLANTEYFDKEAKLPVKVLDKHREGLLIGSGCMNSEFFEVAMNQSEERLKKLAQYFDYIELQPLEDYLHIFESETTKKNIVTGALEVDKEKVDLMKERLIRVMKKIIKVANHLSIPVVATGDVHHIEKHAVKYRDIYIRTPIVGGGYHTLARTENIPSQYYRTTDEMLEAFDYLEKPLRDEIVIKNPQMITNQIEKVEAFSNELFAPTDDFLAQEGIVSIERKMAKMVETNAKAMYGDPLPAIVYDRVKKEMDSITKNKFSTVYYISHLLVKKSLDEGYLVGSRGSVGSSLIATLMDITEVNPLPPHYVCPKCHTASFKMSPEEKDKYGVKEEERMMQIELEKVSSGFDLKPLECPSCGVKMRKDGHDIPFETFLGFKGDKVPDIDLNFSGDYQGAVHEYIRELFGKDRAFRAGTISTVADKTAFGYVKGYLEKKDLILRKAEIERRAKVIAGVKRSTGQHPGGIVVVPSYKEIFDVTPVQYPADDINATWKTTHFDYHSFEANLFKLDVLGHDDPTMIRYLMDFVKQDPINFPFSDARDIPLDDHKVYGLLSGTEVIGLKPQDINSPVASFGVPEMGTNFVRGMLRDSRPKTFADIVKISGLSHGTDVWLNNAETLVTGKNPDYGKIPFSEVIGCRDDIMVYLIQNGLKHEVAFEISEFIRKGKAAKNPDKWEAYSKIMRENSIPEWYIWSAGQIKYMFPKAHATAYVMMALRIAWFKVHRPIYFYSAYFSKRARDFDLIAMQGGEYTIEKRMEEIDQKGNKATETEKRLYTVLEVALEMVKRGFGFDPIDIMRSEARDFVISEDKQRLRLPFVALDGLGFKVAESIVKAREEKLFNSQEDVKNRTGLTKTSFDKLSALDAFKDLPEDSQMSLFDF